MRVVVCHRKKTLVQLAKLNAERQGIQVDVAKDGNDVLAKSRKERPDVIVLGNDLENPSTDETVSMLQADPALKGVEVVVAKGAIPELRKSLKGFRWPRIPTPPEY